MKPSRRTAAAANSIALTELSRQLAQGAFFGQGPSGTSQVRVKLLSRQHRQSVTCPLPPGADKVDSAEGMATLEAMSSHHNFRAGQQNKLVSEAPIAVPDEHAQLVEADQRFQAALDQAIAAGGERVEAVQATVHLKRRTKLSL
jgi:hypothetical protein